MKDKVRDGRDRWQRAHTDNRPGLPFSKGFTDYLGGRRVAELDPRPSPSREAVMVRVADGRVALQQ